MKRLEGVESVKVNLKEKAAEVQLRPSVAFNPKPFRDAIVKAGYQVREIVLGIRGRLEQRGASLTILPDGSKQAFQLTSPPPAPAKPGERAEMRVKLTDESKVPMRVELEDFRAVTPER